jgi:hypothetical protein
MTSDLSREKQEGNHVSIATGHPLYLSGLVETGTNRARRTALGLFAKVQVRQERLQRAFRDRFMWHSIADRVIVIKGDAEEAHEAMRPKGTRESLIHAKATICHQAVPGGEARGQFYLRMRPPSERIVKGPRV